MQNKWFILLFLPIMLLSAGFSPPRSPIKIITVSGTKFQMGESYGTQLREELGGTLKVLTDFYVEAHHIPMAELNKKADDFYQSYPLGYQRFIQGVAKGSGLSLNEAKILNAMETLSSLLTRHVDACSFIAIPHTKTVNKGTLIGRNYDYPAPFHQIAHNLTVTVLLEPDTIPTAIIAMPGQIYCPTCVNKAGLFVELNNGMRSGGYAINRERESLLINLLETTRNSANFAQLLQQLNALKSDYSLIINIASPSNILSIEFSSLYGEKPFMPEVNQPFVSTNLFQNSTWPPARTDPGSAVIRFKNLVQLAAAHTKKFSMSTMQNLLDTKLSEGGATHDGTMYQILFDTHTLELCLKRPLEDYAWQCIDLQPWFEGVWQ
jgi:hypothetical protein